MRKEERDYTFSFGIFFGFTMLVRVVSGLLYLLSYLTTKVVNWPVRTTNRQSKGKHVNNRRRREFI